ncbi:MAG: 6-bladed beta-propeller, partial [Dehalococcoidia bacterium]|nr:6-bladed beta-propeller [Dehalococcoidia bacterium]
MTTEISHINVQYTKTIGRGEQFGPGFTYPVDVARGKEGIMYVLCRSSEFRPEGVRVVVCTTDEEYISVFARGIDYQGPHAHNMDDGSLVWPTSIALDSQENLFISDEWLNRISSFSKDGDFLGKWEERTGSGDGELDRPSGMAFDADDNLYIVDSGNHRVQKFNKDGKYLAQFGTYGSGDGQFNMPWGITIDEAGDIYIADWRNDRIQKFGPDGKFLMKFGSSGSGEGEFDRPTDVAVDQDGVIYVSDWLNNRLQIFDETGKFIDLKTGEAGLSKWGKDKLDANPEMYGERDRAQGLEREKDFWGPTGVTVDNEGNIFVPESARNRIQVY